MARSTRPSASSMLRGLKTRWAVVQPRVALAMDKAAHSISSTSPRVMRPCSSAPTAHSPASSAVKPAMLCASGAVSACQRNTATPASKATNCRAAKTATGRAMLGA
ncbi:hypothetical protein FQZ97_901950 [compost metagenome]